MTATLTITCGVEGCDRPRYGLGYCRGHCARVQRHGDPRADVPLATRGTNGPRCTVEDCSNRPHARNLCSTHLSRVRLHGDVLEHQPVASKRTGCAADACDREHYAHGYCRLHSRRVAAFGIVDLPQAEPVPCAVAICPRTATAAGYCNGHYERLRLHGDLRAAVPLKVLRPDQPCDLDGCDRPHYCLGFCAPHYQQRVSHPRRRALERAALGGVTAQQLAARIAFYGHRCWMCRAPWTCIDHVKPLSVGGTNWPANLRPACTSCNARKHNRWPYPTSTRKAA